VDSAAYCETECFDWLFRGHFDPIFRLGVSANHIEFNFENKSHVPKKMFDIKKTLTMWEYIKPAGPRKRSHVLKYCEFIRALTYLKALSALRSIASILCASMQSIPKL